MVEKELDLFNKKIKLVNNRSFVLDFVSNIEIHDNDIVGVAFWNTPVMFYALKILYPNTTFIMIEDISIKNLYGVDENDIIYVDIDNKEYFPNMKFDKIIMNPPYGDLHLPILAEAYNHLKKGGQIVSIQPVRWLQDPLIDYKQSSDYKKYEDSISKHIKQLDIKSAREMQLLFNTVFSMDLGIYTISDEGGYNYTVLHQNSILNKCIDFMTDNYPSFESDKKNGVRVRFPYMTCGKSNGSGKRKATLHDFGKLLYFIDGIKDGKPWYDFYRKNQYSKTTDTITRSIKFETEQQAINFINQFKCNFVKYITNLIITDVNVREEQVLWMNNIKNPHTGLIGYNSEWTDEDFYTFFNITKEEQKIIEDTIKEYE